MQVSISFFTFLEYFGETEKEITNELENPKIYHKLKFSMLTDEVLTDLVKTGRKQIILFGIEAHVCVLQTSLDLLEKGKKF
jgi:isochorismate hydrolase